MGAIVSCDKMLSVKDSCRLEKYQICVADFVSHRGKSPLLKKLFPQSKFIRSSKVIRFICTIKTKVFADYIKLMMTSSKQRKFEFTCILIDIKGRYKGKGI